MTQEGNKKALTLIRQHVIDAPAESIDIHPFIGSLLKFANSLFVLGNSELSGSILSLIVTLMAEKEPDVAREPARRLALLAKVSDVAITDELEKKLETLIIIADESSAKIPVKMKNTPIVLSSENPGIYQGTIEILGKKTGAGKENDMEIIGYEETTKSIWRIVFDRDYALAIQNALSVRLNGGTIEKVLAKTATDPPYIRGTIFLKEPAFQHNISVSWQ